MVGAGSVLGKTFEDLAYVYKLVDDNKKHNIGYCIDTCHVFASGQYDLQSENSIQKMFEDFDRVCHKGSLKCIHLNDSKEQFNSGKDRHFNILNGEIWKGKKNSLLHLLKVSKQKEIPLILETTPSDIPLLIELQNIKEKL